MAASSLHEKDHFEVDERKIGQHGSIHNELSALAEEELASFDRKMLLKLDLVLVPIMAMLYLLAFLCQHWQRSSGKPHLDSIPLA